MARRTRALLPALDGLEDGAPLTGPEGTAFPPNRAARQLFRLEPADGNPEAHGGPTAALGPAGECPTRLTLEVRDNGRGATKADLARPQALGLLGMRERAELVGGKVRVVGVPGKGTTVLARIPLRPR